MELFLSICVLMAFLLAGKFLRVKVKILQNLFIPASIIAGFLGLVSGKYILNLTPEWITQVWSKMPGVLINVVFAALFLGMVIPGGKILWQRGGSQLCFGVVMGMGQYLIALLLTILVLKPIFHVPDFFGVILEVGFSGGHGTAAGMTGVFQKLGFEAGGALAQMSATVGILTAIIGGVFFINLAVRKGQTVILTKRKGMDKDVQRGLIKKERKVLIARATVASESIEPLAFHFAIIAVAILIGWGMQSLIKGFHPILNGFPLFPLAMIGGILVQKTADKTGVSEYFDRMTFERLLGFSLDMLVVAAIATVRLDLFVENFWPFILLMIAGISWIFFVLFFFAPRMLPKNWVERGVTEFGMQSGVTAMGLLLLRLVDPEYKTDTASAFGFKQIIYEPFLGGGFITALSPFVIIKIGLVKAIFVSLGVILVFLVISKLNGWLRFKSFYKK
jgi:ESS family glutamate:Na+ symporter